MSRGLRACAAQGWAPAKSADVVGTRAGRWLCRLAKEGPSEEVAFELRPERGRSCQRGKRRVSEMAFRVIKDDPSEEVVFELRSERNRSWQWEDLEEDGTQRWFCWVVKKGPL